MKNYILALCLLIMAFYSKAQNNHSLNGRIFDNQKVPLGTAYVVLTTDSINEPQVVKTCITNNEGYFELSNIVSGIYKLKIYHLGYLNKEIATNITDRDIDLGHIFLEDFVQELGEVVITANNVNNFAEKNTYRLSAIDKRSSANALDAMRLLPRVLVGMGDQLLTTRGEQIKVLINGINTTESDLLSISPDNIDRIEYYQTPPARYALLGVGAVVNLITKDNVIGGNLALNLQNALTTGFGNDMLNFKYNLGNTQIGLKYNLSYRDYKKRYIDERLKYTFKDIEYNKNKVGKNSPYDYQHHTFEFSVINQKKDNYILSTNFSLDKFDQDIKNEQDVKQYSPNQILISAINIENNKYLKPSIDLYFNKKIAVKQELTLNVVGTYFETSFFNKYLETKENGIDNFYSFTNIESDKYSLISDAIYSYTFEKDKLSTGLRYMYSYSEQDVSTTGVENLTSKQNDFYGFVELTGTRSLFSYSLSAGINYSSFDSYELDKGYSNLYFRPIINLRYEINKKSDLFLSYQINTQNPTLGELSNNPVMQDYHYAYSGNPNLEPYTSHSALLSYGYMVDNFTFMMDLSYNYYNNPILPYFVHQQNHLLQTYANLDNAKRYSLLMYIQWFPFKLKWLRLRFSGEIFRNESKGWDFAWSHNDFRLIPSLIIQYKKWGGTIFYQSSCKTLNGQLLKYSPSAAYVEVTHKPIKNLTTLLGIRYPLYNGWSSNSQTHETSPVSLYTKETIKDNANMVYLQFTYSFNFGRQLPNVTKKMNNIDKDSGVYKRE